MKAPLRPRADNKLTTGRFGIPEMIGAAILMLVMGAVIYALLKTQVPWLF
jgi:hypothetical protein